MKYFIIPLVILLLGAAGSDGAYFPWLNLGAAGCIMFIAFRYLAIKYKEPN